MRGNWCEGLFLFLLVLLKVLRFGLVVAFAYVWDWHWLALVMSGLDGCVEWCIMNTHKYNGIILFLFPSTLYSS